MVAPRSPAPVVPSRSAPTTKLGAKLAGGSEARPVASKLTAALSASRPFVPYTIPRLGLDVVITLVSTNRQTEIEGEVWARMRDLGLQLNLTTEEQFEAERAARTCAATFLDPETHEPIGTLLEWTEVMDRDTLGDCWRTYADVRESYDPASSPLTDAETSEIVDAIKKNSAIRLRRCGSRRLATFMLSTAAQPASLATPTSSTSESPSEP